MGISRVGLLLAAVFVGGLVVGALGTNVAADSPPVWSVGDFWKLAEPTDLQNYTRFEVTRVDAVKYGIECYEMKLEITERQGSQITVIEATYWMRKTDLAIVGLSVPIFGWNVQYDPPRKMFDWPLETGRIWTWVDDTGTNTVTHTYTVEGKETLTTKAGTFDAWKISDVDDTIWQRTEYVWYSSVAGFQVKSQQKGSDTWQELTEYRHATGGLFPAGFGPESMMFWFLIIGLVVIIAVVVMVVLARRKKKGAQPAMAPPPMTPAAPVQPAYQSPPQYPQGGYQQQPYLPGATDQSGRVVPGASQMVRR